MKLEVLYHDDQLLAINKPHGLLVHRTSIAADADKFALQIIRNQIGRAVHPAHRLDRKTGGVLLFSLNSNTNRSLQKQFAEYMVEKTYHAIVRGYVPEKDTIDYPLRSSRESLLQPSITRYTRLRMTEIPLSSGKHPTSRYSLVEVIPTTGRMHQIRKHFAHIMHPVIGDRPYGCNKQNRFFKETWNCSIMFLHALSIRLEHPVSGQPLYIEAPYQTEFQRMLDILFNYK